MTNQHGPRFARPSWTAKVRGEHGFSVLSTASLAAEQAACYLSSRPAGVVDVEYSESCGRCAGSGRRVVAKPPRLRFAPCPACSGKGELMAEQRVASYVGPEWRP